MSKRSGFWRRCAAVLCALTMLATLAQAADTLSLFDFSAADATARVKPNEDNGGCSFAIADSDKGKGLEVTNKSGGYPGVRLLPENGAWDLSDYGRVEFDITNLGDKKITVSLRVDNDGDWRKNPWNGENVSILPGKKATGRVTFGYSWGKPAYQLDPSKVAAVLIFTGKPKDEIKFRVDAVRAAGKPGDKPSGFVTRVAPKDGSIFDFTANNAAELLDERGAAVAMNTAEGYAEIAFKPDAKNKWPGVFFSPPEGVMWNLGNFMQVDFKVSNPGDKPVRVICRVDNKNANGRNNCANGDATLAAGETKTITVPFASAEPWNGNVKDSGARLSSVDVVGALVFTENPTEEAKIRVHGIRASQDPNPVMPEWLGKRPPVDGDWVMTFSDDFDGNAVDETKWSYYGPNYWDKRTRWSKDNTIVKDGVVTMRYEKKKGFHNDDPTQKEQEYTGGFLETYGKWTQLYGYFEARMKLPTAPGLWPAFWMMPDRGVEAGEQWKRQDTKKGGMEFDIMEHLTRWGPNRYNVAMHWDGYQKEHKHIGTTMIYLQPDKDGFITCGVLWEPGKLTYYGNGQVVGVWENERVSSVQADMMFTMPQGGWDNSPLDDKQLPADFVVDYVRAWQLKERVK